jgi:hypothetical protein
MKCPFKSGDKIVCIKNIDETKGIMISSQGDIITKNNIDKLYEVIMISLRNGINFPMIYSDGGRYLVSDWSCYITLKEYRKLKLKKINESSL